MAQLPPPFKPQDQRSATDQLRTLVVLANREGLYDAADLVQRFLLKPESRVTTAEILASVSDGITLSDEVQAILAEARATPQSDGT
jgi:hypothetical protein